MMVTICGRPYYATNQNSFIYFNAALVAKQGLETFLKARYSSISALNAAWVSSYTTFDSAGMVIGYPTSVLTGSANNPAETSAGNGIASYSLTTAHTPVDRYSVSIAINGTIVAGNQVHDSGGGSTDPTNTVDGRIAGPYVSGTITYATGALPLTFSTSTPASLPWGSRNICKISIASNVVTVQTCAQHGLWTGAKVNIAGTTNYNGTAIGPITVLDSITFTYAKTASLATETNGTYALNALPSASDIIGIWYTYGAWEHGTGLMDEAANHTWSNSDQFLCSLTGVSATEQKDWNDYGFQIADIYYSGIKAQINTNLPQAMYAGHEAIAHQGIPKSFVLRAAAKDLDVATTAYDGQLTQAQLDGWYAAGYGDRPLFDSFYPTAMLDSPSATGAGNAISAIGFLTKEDQGNAYYTRVQSALNKKYTASGTYPYVGIGTWTYHDMDDGSGNGGRFGMIDVNDNSYDGICDVAAPVSSGCPGTAAGGNETYTTPIWQVNHSYGFNGSHIIVGLVSGVYYRFEEDGGGTSGGTQPNWTVNCPVLGNTCSDNGMTWINDGAWTKSAMPANMGNAFTPAGTCPTSATTGCGIIAANALPLNVSALPTGQVCVTRAATQ